MRRLNKWVWRITWLIKLKVRQVDYLKYRSNSESEDRVTAEPKENKLFLKKENNYYNLVCVDDNDLDEEKETEFKNGLILYRNKEC